MQALSVKQPWALQLVSGEKSIEVRSWETDYRGHLLICASAAPKNVFNIDSDEPEVRNLLPAGCVIGIVDLLDVRPMVKEDEYESWVDYKKGAFAWVVEPVTFVRPDPVTGRLKLFEYSKKLKHIGDSPPDWIFSYAPPQGDIKFTLKCPVHAT
jgi:hypothetical protein